MTELLAQAIAQLTTFVSGQGAIAERCLDSRDRLAATLLPHEIRSSQLLEEVRSAL